MRVFLDTTSLIKLYHSEKGSEAQKGFLTKELDGFIFSEIAMVEFHSALFSKVRIGELDKMKAFQTLGLFHTDLFYYEVIPCSSEIVNLSLFLLDRHAGEGLNSARSLQLATALKVKDKDVLYSTHDELLESFFVKENLKLVVEELD